MSGDGGRTGAMDEEGLHASYLRAVAVAGLPDLGGNVDTGWLVADGAMVAVVLADGSLHRSSDGGGRFECVADGLAAPRWLACSTA